MGFANFYNTYMTRDFFHSMKASVLLKEKALIMNSVEYKQVIKENSETTEGIQIYMRS